MDLWDWLMGLEPWPRIAAWLFVLVLGTLVATAVYDVAGALRARRRRMGREAVR